MKKWTVNKLHLTFSLGRNAESAVILWKPLAMSIRIFSDSISLCHTHMKIMLWFEIIHKFEKIMDSRGLGDKIMLSTILNRITFLIALFLVWSVSLFMYMY